MHFAGNCCWLSNGIALRLFLIVFAEPSKSKAFSDDDAKQQQIFMYLTCLSRLRNEIHKHTHTDVCFFYYNPFRFLSFTETFIYFFNLSSTFPHKIDFPTIRLAAAAAAAKNGRRTRKTSLDSAEMLNVL